MGGAAKMAAGKDGVLVGKVASWRGHLSCGLEGGKVWGGSRVAWVDGGGGKEVEERRGKRARVGGKMGWAATWWNNVLNAVRAGAIQEHTSY